MKAKALEKLFKEKLGDAVLDSRIQERKVVGKAHESVWMRIKKDALLDAAGLAMSHEKNHFAVISGTDLGENIELLYHFCVGYGEPGGEVTVTFCVPVEKGGSVPTITKIVPGAVLTEREKMEFFGVDVEGLEDKRRAFLTGDLAECNPWIKDDPATNKMARNTHEKGVRP